MLFQLDAYKLQDKYDKVINIYGDAESIWNVWFKLENKYILKVYDDNHMRINMNKGIKMVEFRSQKDIDEFDKLQEKDSLT